jgi:hypothetical protein
MKQQFAPRPSLATNLKQTNDGMLELCKGVELQNSAPLLKSLSRLKLKIRELELSEQHASCLT